MKYERKRRVNEALRQVLARGVEELADPAIGFVTITSVDVTRDLEYATVFVSVLGGEKRRQSALRGLERAHGVLQARVARELHLRRTPQLTFHYDGGVDRAMRITELLDESGEVTGEGPDGSESDERT